MTSDGNANCTCYGDWTGTTCDCKYTFIKNVNYLCHNNIRIIKIYISHLIKGMSYNFTVNEV